MTVKEAKGVTKAVAPLFYEDSCFSGTRVVAPCLERSATVNTKDIQVSEVFSVTEHTYGNYLYRSTPLHLFDKLEFMGAKQILDWGTQILLSIRLPEIQIFCTVPLVLSLFHHFHETLTP